jgi:hypothetical protein
MLSDLSDKRRHLDMRHVSTACPYCTASITGVPLILKIIISRCDEQPNNYFRSTTAPSHTWKPITSLRMPDRRSDSDDRSPFEIIFDTSRNSLCSFATVTPVTGMSPSAPPTVRRLQNLSWSSRPSADET